MRDATADQRVGVAPRIVAAMFLLRAALAAIALGAHGLGVSLGHVFSFFGLAIVAVAIAVVDLGGGVDPDEAGAATGYCGGGGLGRRPGHSGGGRWCSGWRGRGCRSGLGCWRGRGGWGCCGGG